MEAAAIIDFYANGHDIGATGWTRYDEAVRAMQCRRKELFRDLRPLLNIGKTIDQSGVVRRTLSDLHELFSNLETLTEWKRQNWDKDPELLQKIMAQQCRHCQESWEITQGGDHLRIPKPEDVSGVMAAFIESPDATQQQPAAQAMPWPKIVSVAGIVAFGLDCILTLVIHSPRIDLASVWHLFFS